MGLDAEYIDGQTPLDEEEKEGLLIPTIATHGELDEFEQQNEMVDPIWTVFVKVKENKFQFSGPVTRQFKQKALIIPLSSAHQQAGVNVKVCGGKISRRENFLSATRRA